MFELKVYPYSVIIYLVFLYAIKECFMNLKLHSAYNGSLTREQFLFSEMRITAQLMNTGISDDEIIDTIISNNLFQFPTERMIKNLARVCVRRLHLLNSTELIAAIANSSVEIGKQIVLYAMMRDSRLMADFMITVVGEKYRTKDMTFGDIDLNVFFIRLQEQDEKVASWSESTVKKIKQVMKKVLVENGYLDTTRSKGLNPILIESVLENAIRDNNDEAMLPAFNCFD